MKPISSQIYMMRVSANLTQRQFAKLVGVSCPTVKAWESGRFASIRASSLRKLREAFNLSCEEIYALLGLEPEEDFTGSNRFNVSDVKTLPMSTSADRA